MVAVVILLTPMGITTASAVLCRLFSFLWQGIPVIRVAVVADDMNAIADEVSNYSLHLKKYHDFCGHFCRLRVSYLTPEGLGVWTTFGARNSDCR